jgi:beta-exotoxin I transport system permease protein
MPPGLAQPQAAAVLLRNVFGKTIRDLRWPTFWVAVALAAIAGYFTLLYPTYSKSFDLQSLLDSMPPAMKALIGGQFADVSTVNGFLNIELFPLILPAVLAGYATAMGTGITAGEESRGTIDVLLSYPIERWRMIVEKAAAVVLSLAVIAAAMWAGAVGGAVGSSSTIQAPYVAAGLFLATLLALDFGALGLLIAAATGRRSAAIGITVALLVVMYFMNALAPIIDSLNAVKQLSLFYWYLEGDPLRSGLVGGDAVVLAVVALMLFALSLVAFERRNLSA